MRSIAKTVAVLATVAVGLLMASPANAAGVAVLTTGSLGGPNVTAGNPGGDTASSGLKSNTTATFVSSGGSVSCTVSALAATVLTNPDAGGVATESLTLQTFSNCTPHITGVTCVQSITVNNLPYNASVNGTTKAVDVTAGTAGPVQATVKLCTLLGSVTCVYRALDANGANALHGTASNADNSITFTNQGLTRSSGSSLCPSTSAFSATYAPVLDTSVAGNPPIFVQ